MTLCIIVSSSSFISSLKYGIMLNISIIYVIIIIIIIIKGGTDYEKKSYFFKIKTKKHSYSADA